MRIHTFLPSFWTLFVLLFVLAGCSKAEIRQAQVMTQAEIDAHNRGVDGKTDPAGPDEPSDPTDPDDPLPPDPVNPDEPAPSDDRITDGSVYFIRPTALGLKDGSSWNNAMDAAGLRDLIAQKLGDDGTQDDAAAYAQADKLNGVKFYFCSGKYLLANAAEKVVKLEWTKYASPVKLSFYGGYSPASSGVDLTQRNTASHVSMLTGDANGNGGADASDYRIFILGNQTDILFDGVTFAYAYSAANGGVFQCSAGGSGDCTLTLQDCIFRSNTAVTESYSGAAVCAQKCTLTANSCTFSSNAARNGAALSVDNVNSRVTMTSCTFSKNTAGNCGGAINFSRGSLTLDRCTFRENVSQGYAGGAIHANGTGATLTCNGCTFTGNEAVSQGSAVSMEEGTVTLGSCTFSSNRSATANVGNGSVGGTVALLKANGILKLNACAFRNNTTSGTGAAVLQTEGRLYIDDCKFDGNIANNRACLRLNNGLCYMNRSAITNTTVSGDWGVAIQTTSLGALCMNNVTIALNKAKGSGNDPVVNGTANSLIVNSTIADRSAMGLFRIEGGKTAALLNSILVNGNSAKPSVLFSGAATVKSLGSCIVGSVSGANGSDQIYTPGTGDKSNANFATLDMNWDASGYVYKWSGVMEGHTRMNAASIAGLARTALPVSVRGVVKVKDSSGTETETEVFKVENAGADFCDWVAGIAADSFTVDALGVARGSATTCGAWQAR